VIIGLTGKARSGKDTIAKYLCEHYGFKHYDFYKDVLVPELEKRGLEPTKMNASLVGNEMRKEEGMDIMAKRLLKKIDVPDAVVTGFRSPEEVEYFKEHTHDFTLVFVDAEPEVRFSRRSPLDPQTKEEFFKRDEMDEKGKNMEAVFLMADNVIDNNGTLDELYEKVEELLDEIVGE